MDDVKYTRASVELKVDDDDMRQRTETMVGDNFMMGAPSCQYWRGKKQQSK